MPAVVEVQVRHVSLPRSARYFAFNETAEIEEYCTSLYHIGTVQ